MSPWHPSFRPHGRGYLGHGLSSLPGQRQLPLDYHHGIVDLDAPFTFTPVHGWTKFRCMHSFVGLDRPTRFSRVFLANCVWCSILVQAVSMLLQVARFTH